MELKITKIQLNNSVSDSLTKFQREILPTEISEDNNVDWVMRFGNLDKKENYKNDNENPLSSTISPIIQNYVTYNITFYFATIFYIGRLWKVSELSIEDICNALNEKNIENTIDINQELFERDLPKLYLGYNSIKKDIFNTLFELLFEAKEIQIASLKKSKYFWKIWLNEIREFRKTIDTLNEIFYSQNRYNNRNDDFEFGYSKFLSPMLAFSYESRQLFKILKEDGIEIKNNPKPNIMSGLQMNNPLSILTSLGGFEKGELKYFLRDYWHEFNRSLEYQKELTELLRYTPIIEQIERNLLILFENTNPFENYSILNKIPDDYLKSVWNKCKLPYNQTFYYATNWLDSLEENLSYSYKELPFKENVDKDTIQQYSKSLDSVIKRNWVKLSKPTGLTNNEFIQRIFENEWIMEMIKGATYPIRVKKTQQWTLGKLIIVLNTICENLVQYGYSIEVPTTQRLEKLWNVFLKESYYNGDW